MKQNNLTAKIFSHLIGATLVCAFALGLPIHATALPEAEAQVGKDINNVGLGFSYHLPAGWGEIRPMLLALYNTTVNSLSQGAEAPYMVAAYSNTGTQMIPPILMMHYIEQPISAAMVTPYNNMFMEEARDVEGKTALAQKLGLASDIRFIEAKDLRPDTPMAILEADSKFGFTVTVMASPYYFKHGMLILTYFAPQNDFPRYEDEMLTFFRNITINQDQLPN